MPIAFRPTRIEDLNYVLRTERAAENAPYVGQGSLEEHLAAMNDSDAGHFIVEDEDRRRVGYLILAGLNSPDRCIEFRRMVISEKGQGYGRQALRWAKRLAFEQRQAHRLWLDVIASNQPARGLYESEGFVVEGLLRDRHFYGDHYESLVIMAMLNSEYTPR
jgi:diamine N-acetyltransferase